MSFASTECVALVDYRLEDLARVSGVSARNIRAYRERGLLDPPRRSGRSALYGDHHVAQLQAISNLLRRGFSSAHIAEFIAGIRGGHDLAEILGMRDAIFGSRQERTPAAVAIDPDSAEAQRLCERGLANVVDGKLVFVNPVIADIVSGADDQLEYIRTMVRISDAAQNAIDALADAVVEVLKVAAIERFGPDALSAHAEGMETLRRVVADHRELGEHVVADEVAAAMQRHLVTAVAAFTTDVLLGGNWDPAATPMD
jgi:DNA-binding transcriptional MerR regulator